METNRSYSVSITQSVSIISVASQTLSVSLTMVSKDHETAFASETMVPTIIWIYTETVIMVEVTFDEESEDFTMSAGLVIGLATGGTIIVFILALIGLYIYRNVNIDSSDLVSDEESSDGLVGNENAKDESALTDQTNAHLSELSKMITKLDEEQEEQRDDGWLG